MPHARSETPVDLSAAPRFREAPALIYQRLAMGERLVLVRGQPSRAPILGGDGQPSATPTPVMTVGIEPSRVHDCPAALVLSDTTAQSHEQALMVDAGFERSPRGPLSVLQR